jgi:hypothetical protein
MQGTKSHTAEGKLRATTAHFVEFTPTITCFVSTVDVDESQHRVDWYWECGALLEKEAAAATDATHTMQSCRTILRSQANDATTPHACAKASGAPTSTR